MKNLCFTVPYLIGTYLIRYDNDAKEHLDKVNGYSIDKNGISAILMLDVETNPRLSTPISIDSLLQNWKEDTNIHLSTDIGTRLQLNLPFEEGPKLKLNK